MKELARIKKAYERNKRAVELRPSTGQGIGKSRITMSEGTTCTIEGSGWTLTGDIGRESGGNNAGPGPGVFERAALGTCLAIGYVQQAAVMGIPLVNISVDVETVFDARGMLGIDNRPPGFDSIRYTVNIESPASEEKLLKLIDKADKYSPVKDDFMRAIPIGLPPY